MISIADLFDYLARPRFHETRANLSSETVGALVGLLFLTLALAVVLSGVVGAIVAGAMGELPENVNNTLAETDPWQLLFAGVIVAPLLEEVIFRSWLGLPRSSLLGLPALLCVIAILAAVLQGGDSGVAFLVGLGLAGLYTVLARRVGDMTEADRAHARIRLFPYAFWGSALVFAFTHLSNFEGGVGAALASPVLIVAILPQLMAGAVFGYVRMRAGMPAAILFHAAYNAVLIGIAVLALSVSDGSNAPSTATLAQPVGIGLWW